MTIQTRLVFQCPESAIMAVVLNILQELVEEVTSKSISLGDAHIKSEVVDCVPYKDPKQMCTECDKVVSRKYFQQHVKSVHLKIKDIKCDQCSSAFTNKQLLRLHMITHSGDASM